MRILFSSCADNFEIFMSDLLYEIYLAKPETLKSNAQVTVKDVLGYTFGSQLPALQSVGVLPRKRSSIAEAWIRRQVGARPELPCQRSDHLL
jgi:hypothetical protein